MEFAHILGFEMSWVCIDFMMPIDEVWFWLFGFWNSRPWLCYWILHSIALLGESVDGELENNAIDFLGRCQVRLNFYCLVSCPNCGNSSDLFIHLLVFLFPQFFPFLLLLPVTFHFVLSFLSHFSCQGADGGYGGGPGQVSICLFLENVCITIMLWNWKLKMETRSFYFVRSLWCSLSFWLWIFPNIAEKVRIYN